MRIFLLPLSTRQTLIYCQKSARKVEAAPLSYTERIQNKATDTWAKWEEAESGWKKTVVTYGNAGLKRIPYQEWGLKSFPPLNAKLQAKHLTDNKKIDVLFPGNVMRSEDVPKVMQRLAMERKQWHRQRFFGSMFAMPLTIPFALIPVIPNIPFFYVTYRCWSHWRALRGSDHLEFIVENRLFQQESPKQIEDLYDKIAPDLDYTFVTRSQVMNGSAAKEEVILTAGSHTQISKALQVPEISGEVERAVWQVENALKKEEKEAAIAAEEVKKRDEEAQQAEKESK